LITFHPNDKSKAIWIQPFIVNFQLTAENAGAQSYTTGGIIMKTWNNLFQYQMLLDALNFSRNSMVELHREFINSYKAEITVNTHVANDFIPTAIDISKQDLAIFLLVGPFVSHSTHMEGLTRTDNDATYITNGIIQIQPFHAANNAHTLYVNVLASRYIVFSSVCFWNLIITAGTRS
jgi:hypothetical protein